MSGELAWGAGASPGSIGNRAEPIRLLGEYAIRWRPYSEVPAYRNREFRYLLMCYDSPEISAYPEDSGCSYTDYFFPKAYQRGERLAKEAKNLYQIFSDVRKEFGLSSDFEIPMEYFAFTVENALKKNGVHGDQCDWISINQWREAIKLSGYVESEIYMALAQGG